MEAITMSELARRNTVTLKIGHNCVCPCPCCHGNQAIEYSLIIIPWHLRDQLGLAPALRLKRDELWALLSVIEKNRPGFWCKGESISRQDEAVSFRLCRNHDDHWLGEFSLHVMGGGVDDIFSVCESELDSLVQRIKEMERRDEAALSALARRKEREKKIKSRMKSKTFQEVSQKAKQMNSGLFEDNLGAQVAAVLLAAAFFVGPDIDRLVDFTGHPRSLVSDISCRMHDSGLWASGEVFVEHWFNEQLEWELEGLSADCSVATGCMVAWRTGEHESWNYEPSGRMWSHRAT
jgi:hypothetical protein